MFQQTPAALDANVQCTKTRMLNAGSNVQCSKIEKSYLLFQDMIYQEEYKFVQT